MEKTYPVVHIPEPVLSEQTQNIPDPLDQSIQELIPSMFTTMHKAHGIGLAAPQIGINKAIAVIEIKQKRYVLINPVLSSISDEKILFDEGCLSIPGKEFPIVRSNNVTVRYLDENGKKCKIKTDGLLAIALQHEIDHLNGIVIADRYDQQERSRELFE